MSRNELPEQRVHRQAPRPADPQTLLPAMEQDRNSLRVLLGEDSEGTEILRPDPPRVLHLDREEARGAVDDQVDLRAGTGPPEGVTSDPGRKTESPIPE